MLPSHFKNKEYSGGSRNFKRGRLSNLKFKLLPIFFMTIFYMAREGVYQGF